MAGLTVLIYPRWYRLVWWLWRLVDLVADRMREQLRVSYPRTAQSA